MNNGKVTALVLSQLLLIIFKYYSHAMFALVEWCICCKFMLP